MKRCAKHPLRISFGERTIRVLWRTMLCGLVNAALIGCADTEVRQASELNGRAARAEIGTFHKYRRDITRKLHAEIVNSYPAYQQILHQDRALAGCINWETTAPSNIDLRVLRAVYTAIGSDTPVFISELMKHALHNCDSVREKGDLHCQCVPIDKNGEPALQVPESIVEKFQAALEGPHKGRNEVAVKTPPSEAGPFDGVWDGNMRCSSCENCTGPIRRHVTIKVEKYRFEIVPDTSYYAGEGYIDQDGNIQILPKADDFYSRKRRFTFNGIYNGESFELHGTRGPRSCDITLSRAESSP